MITSLMELIKMEAINNKKSELLNLAHNAEILEQTPVKKLSVVCGDDWIKEAKAPEFLIDGLLPPDAHGIMSGASMTFKTFTALRMAHSICTGLDFMGCKVYKTGKVLYVCGEGQGALQRRLKALDIVIGGFHGNFHHLISSISIDNENDMKALKSTILSIKPVLVIFDTFASLISETEENSTSDVGRVLKLIRDTCREDGKKGVTSSMIVHHYGKDHLKGLRGASNFTNDTDFVITLKRASNSMSTTMSCGKMKDGEDFKDISLKAEIVELDGLVMQNGQTCTSLVMVEGSEIVSKMKLSKQKAEYLEDIKQALVIYGIDPPKEIIDDIPDWIKPPNKVISLSDMTKFISDKNDKILMSDKNKIKNTLQQAQNRAKKDLIENKVITKSDCFLWIN